MAEQHVYFFAQGRADGNGVMKGELGGKGAGLAEMTNAGLPVPPGFTLSTRACRIYFDNQGKLPGALEDEFRRALARLEQVMGQRLGARENPLLVSVRSGAKFSMPGMMDTILNLGLNDQTVQTLAAKSRNPRFAMDCYRRFIQMFGNVVLEIPKGDFDHVFESAKKRSKARFDTDLTAAALEGVIRDYKKLVQKKTGSPFPQDAGKQLVMARDAVFRSWNNPRAIHYRRMNSIPETLGTAVNVQTMVFGNLGETSGTGVGFTRNPSTGEKEFYGEFLMNAQGEDVVAGIRTPVHIGQLKAVMPEVYSQLRQMTDRLERHYKDMQDFEFTIQEGKLYMLQTRNGKRTGKAAVKVAVDMVAEGLLTKREALLRVEPSQLDQLLHPVLDESKPVKVIATGLPASPGAAVGQVVFNADDAVQQGKKHPVVLVRPETVPDDIHGMDVAAGILTSRGGMTSHAAVVARGMGKCCVAGAGAISVDEKKKQMTVGKLIVKEGDWISLDGSTGRVILGKVPTMDPDPASGDFAKFMGWADQFRRLGVRANADIPRDAAVARRYGAEGIGLCRTEHMFFAEERIPYM
ncbi:MAG: pyruvate, phosphate dikinase, partial [Terriglobia bacterium]